MCDLPRKIGTHQYITMYIRNLYCLMTNYELKQTIYYSRDLSRLYSCGNSHRKSQFSLKKLAKITY